MTELLHTADPAEVAAFETAFYEAFAGVTANRLVRWLWNWDEPGRLRTRVPYPDQLVYVERDAARAVTAALAVNTRLAILQSEAFGFTLPSTAEPRCELLAFFCAADHDLARRRAFFWGGCAADLVRRGFRTGYGTTARGPLAVYRREGARVIADSVVEGEERFLLEVDLTRRNGRT